MKKFIFTAEISDLVSLEVEAETIEEAEQIAHSSEGSDWERDPHAGSWDILWESTTEEEI